MDARYLCLAAGSRQWCIVHEHLSNAFDPGTGELIMGWEPDHLGRGVNDEAEHVGRCSVSGKRDGRKLMNYLCLVYYSEATMQERGDDHWRSLNKEYQSYGNGLTESGVLAGLGPAAGIHGDHRAGA